MLSPVADTYKHTAVNAPAMLEDFTVVDHVVEGILAKEEGRLALQSANFAPKYHNEPSAARMAPPVTC